MYQDKVTLSGIFDAATGSVAADTVEKSLCVPEFEALFTIIGLLTVTRLFEKEAKRNPQTSFAFLPLPSHLPS